MEYNRAISAAVADYRAALGGQKLTPQATLSATIQAAISAAYNATNEEFGGMHLDSLVVAYANGLAGAILNVRTVINRQYPTVGNSIVDRIKLGILASLNEAAPIETVYMQEGGSDADT